MICICDVRAGLRTGRTDRDRISDIFSLKNSRKLLIVRQYMKKFDMMFRVKRCTANWEKRKSFKENVGISLKRRLCTKRGMFVITNTTTVANIVATPSHLIDSLNRAADFLAITARAIDAAIIATENTRHMTTTLITRYSMMFLTAVYGI